MKAADRRRLAAWLLLAVSGLLLLGALGFQFLGGLAPCEMCHWQRWAHLAVIGAAALALMAPAVLPLPLLAMATSAGLAAFHAGVEQRWWDGPGCAAAFRTGDDLLGSIIASPLVRCDQIPWSFLGLSMAGWNAVISFAALLAALAIWRRA
ncbi:MAG: disulfide bond formation protein B [Sphingomonadaceae bacterium]